VGVPLGGSAPRAGGRGQRQTGAALPRVSRQTPVVSTAPVSFFPSPQKARRAFWLSLTLVVGSGVLSGVTHDELLAVITVLLIAMPIIWWRRLTDPTPSLQLDHVGLIVRDVARISWAQLERLEVFTVGGGSTFLGFFVTDPAAIRVVSPPLKRALRFLDRAIERAPASLSSNLVRDLDEVVENILLFKAVPVEGWRSRPR